MTYTNKTQATDTNPQKYLLENFSGDEKILKETRTLIDMYVKASGSKCVMWNKIFGFGKYFYKDSRGGEHEYLMTGFAISKSGYTLYNIMGWETYKKDIEKLGKYKISSKSCLAIKRVEDIDPEVLSKVIKTSYADIAKHYKTKE